jgi:hypothetical protein
VERPRQVLPGGYISFINPASDEVQQILFLGSAPVEKNLGPAKGPSLRVFVDGLTYGSVMENRKPNHKLSEWNKKHRHQIEEAAKRRAASYELPEVGDLATAN